MMTSVEQHEETLIHIIITNRDVDKVRQQVVLQLTETECTCYCLDQTWDDKPYGLNCLRIGFKAKSKGNPWLWGVFPLLVSCRLRLTLNMVTWMALPLG